MTKIKLKDATKELLKNSEEVLESVTSLRKKANGLMTSMKSMQNKFQKEEEQHKAEEKKAEQQRLISQQTKAYTMPDTEDVLLVLKVAADEAVTNETAEAKKTPVEVKSETIKPEVQIEQPKEESKLKNTVKSRKASKSANEMESQRNEETKEVEKTQVQLQEETKDAKVSKEKKEIESKKPEVVVVQKDTQNKEEKAKPETKMAESKNNNGDVKEDTSMKEKNAVKAKKNGNPEDSDIGGRVQKEENSALKTDSNDAPKAETVPVAEKSNNQNRSAGKPATVQASNQTVASANGQQARPAGNTEISNQAARSSNVAQGTQSAKPVNAQTGVQGNSAVRPANGQPGQYGRPANGQPGQYGRPANGQPGQYGRPANGQPGQYGRPANGQPGQYGRPANGQPGQYGRPANGQPGQYGRPANGQPGQYGRPANGQPGQYGRPANGQPGQYGRPANGQPGQYGRPANGQPGQYGRPANGQSGQTGRPMNGGQGGAQRPQGGNRSGAGNQRKPSLDIVPAVEKERVSNYDPNKKNYVRQHDPERVAKNKKQLAKESYSNDYDDDVVRGRRSKGKKMSAQQMMAPIKIEKAYMTAETISVKDLTERIGKPAGEILKKLMLLGKMGNINSELDYDTASLICADFDITLEMNLAKTAEDNLAETDFEDIEEDLEPRPPVVTIMGHVDHGKTSLLDYIRKSKVTAGEAGGITQHIGAYTVNLDGRVITFLDTPGHEAFTAMRARGAQSTDIAILVVAADDGVMPQTIEAINHAKAANVPIIVAINKMDKPTANPDRVKQDLTKYEVICEEWGGDTIMVPVSAMTGDGVDDLLEMILLQADMLQLRANPNRMAKGVIIEAKLDKARGPLATVLLQNGTLHVGDNIVAGMASGHVRAMLNDKGERVKEAGPSMPVEVSGFAEVPSAGDDMMAVADDRLGRQVVQERKDRAKAERNASTTKVSLDNLFSRIDASKLTNLNLIIKADVQGSVEAVKQALEKLSNDEVKVRVLHSAVGAITKDDVNLASAFDAIIIGFNIRPDAGAREAAEHEGVDVRLYRVIYQAIEEMEKAMKGLLEPEFKEVMLGHAEVRNTFHITGAGTVAGCYVKDGKVQRNAQVRLIRDNVVVYEGKLSSLKRFKDDAKEVAEGYECGISFDNYNDIKEGDTIECFVMEEIER